MDKENAIITDGLSSFAPPIGESYKFNAMNTYSIILKSRI
jgi:hypothetical protein